VAGRRFAVVKDYFHNQLERISAQAGKKNPAKMAEK